MIPCIFVWLAIIIIMCIVEAVTLGLVSIWFAGGAVAGFIGAIAGVPLYGQIILFLAVSIVLLIFTRPIAVKKFNIKRDKTNLDAMIGQEAIVIEPVNNLKGTGVVVYKGEEWSAKAPSNNLVILEGTIVEVLSIEGVKLIVEPKTLV